MILHACKASPIYIGNLDYRNVNYIYNYYKIYRTLIHIANVNMKENTIT